jgi:nitrogenase cofactor biosynthesis protein NifB
MGAAQALMGIEGCMVILHGSQGCATYIRRHMATHYNEPIDIASSSLTEHGTVYGGEENLIKGVKNLITLYRPKAIGVLTTCLAETIGEDINAIIKKIPENEIKNVSLIPVSTAGYAGAHTDGFESATRAVVEKFAKEKAKPNGCINIIACEMSCADGRYIKNILDKMKIKYAMLPDISQNLDRPYAKNYERLASGGTKISDIEKMSGAKGSLSIGLFTPEKSSSAHYLYEKFAVEYARLPLPIGLENSIKFFDALSQISGEKIPKEIEEEKGRMIDAMIDSHKYNASGRAAVFGEPELVYGLACLCLENGILPVICATGSKCKDLRPSLEAKIKKLAQLKLEKDFYIADGADFSEIEEAVRNLKPNVLIGSSDARRIEEKTGIPLIRTGFPIHDRIGGQRQLKIGFEGSLNLLDEITNALIKQTADTYRQFNYDAHFKGASKINDIPATQKSETLTIRKSAAVNSQLSLKHPCFSCGAAHTNARLHLPVAPECNISCNYCLRKYDCANESRPGITSSVLTPDEAAERFIEVKKRLQNLSVVGIAGPGDALANFDAVRETLSKIREIDKDVIFCLSTNGLMLPFYANDLISLSVSHVTVTINSVYARTGEKIYKSINYLGKIYTGAQAAEILLKNQLDGLKFLSSKGVVCKVNIVDLAGVNEEDISDIVKTVKSCGASITNIMQMIPVKGTPFENLPLVSMSEINKKRKECENIMPQMFHCKQCRADAAGLLGQDKPVFQFQTKEQAVSDVNIKPLLPSGRSCAVRYAAASKSGVLIDLHFGMAGEFYIYEYDERTDKLKMIEKRGVEKYCSGKTDCGDKTDKIGKIIFTIKDCAAVFCMRIGDAPAKRLKENAISVYETYDTIEDGIRKVINERINEEERVGEMY